MEEEFTSKKTAANENQTFPFESEEDSWCQARKSFDMSTVPCRSSETVSTEEKVYVANDCASEKNSDQSGIQPRDLRILIIVRRYL